MLLRRIAARRVGVNLARDTAGRIINGVSLTAIATLTGLLVALGIVTWFAADDYCNWMHLDERGIAGAMRWLYFEWSGRLATGFAMFLTLALVDLPRLHWVSALCGAGLLVVAGLLARLAGAADARWPVRMFALAALSLGLYPLLGQTVFWTTGALVYLLPLILLLVWIIDTRRLLHGATAAGPVAGFAMSALLGNAIELLWPIVLIYVGFMGMRERAAMTGDRWRALGVRMAGFLLGGALLATAPGNLRRAEATPESFRHDPGYLFAQGRMIAAEVVANGQAVMLLLVATMVLAVVVRLALQGRLPAPVATSDRVGIFESCVLIGGGIASLTPMLLVPAQFAPRNAFYLYVLVLLAATALYADAIRTARAARGGRAVIALVIGAGLAATAAASAQLAPDLAFAQSLRERLVLRDRALREAASRQETDVVVPAFRQAVPRTLHYVEIFPDPGAWLNRCVARYYRLDSVRVQAGTTAQ